MVQAPVLQMVLALQKMFVIVLMAMSGLSGVALRKKNSVQANVDSMKFGLNVLSVLKLLAIMINNVLQTGVIQMQSDANVFPALFVVLTDNVMIHILVSNVIISNALGHMNTPKTVPILAPSLIVVREHQKAIMVFASKLIAMQLIAGLLAFVMKALFEA